MLETCLSMLTHAWSMLDYVLSLFFVYDVCRTTAKCVLLVCCLHWTTRPSTTWKSCNKPSRMHWLASGQAGGTQDQDQLRQVQPLLRTPMGSSTTRQRRMNCRANSSFTSCTMRQLFSPSLTPPPVIVHKCTETCSSMLQVCFGLLLTLQNMLQTPDDWMHQFNLGIWLSGLKTTFHEIETYLQSFEVPVKNPKNGEAKTRKVISDAQIKRIWYVNLLERVWSRPWHAWSRPKHVWALATGIHCRRRLRDTLLKVTPEIAGFRVDYKVANVAFIVTKAMKEKGKSSAGLAAREHHQLMLVTCLYLLETCCSMLEACCGMLETCCYMVCL